jgi:large subunit ribosomal protein L9
LKAIEIKITAKAGGENYLVQLQILISLMFYKKGGQSIDRKFISGIVKRTGKYTANVFTEM